MLINAAEIRDEETSGPVDQKMDFEGQCLITLNLLGSSVAGQEKIVCVYYIHKSRNRTLTMLIFIVKPRI